MQRRPLSEAERLDWVQLARSEQVGPITFFRLLERFGSASAALQALPELARRGGRRAALRLASRSEAEAELSRRDKLGARLLAACEPEYPPALRACEDRPPLLYVRGNGQLLTQRMLAIVGARNASLNGRQLAGTLAAALGGRDFVIVSGLARGIDGAAHAAALGTGTLAVMAGGVDVVYPPEHQALYEKIAEAGLVVAEMPPATEPQARHFPRRNRIIAGLGEAVIVVEAALQSGSLITARLANEYGRDVFAVPGSPLDPRCRGSNRLLREGALLVESADDVIQQLGRRQLPEPEPPADLLSPPAALPDAAATALAQRQLLDLLGFSATDLDELQRGCDLSAAVFHTALLELELAGRIERQPGNRVQRIAGEQE